MKKLFSTKQQNKQDEVFCAPTVKAKSPELLGYPVLRSSQDLLNELLFSLFIPYMILYILLFARLTLKIMKRNKSSLFTSVMPSV